MAGDSGTCCSMCGAGFGISKTLYQEPVQKPVIRGGYRGHGGDSY